MPAGLSAAQRWGLRLLLALGMPLLCLLTVEGLLRGFGCGYPTSFFLSRELEGHPVWVDNWRFGWRFFPRAVARYPLAQVISKKKPADTIRIVVLGESAAMGDPAPEYGFARMIEVLLGERFPEHRFEIVNTAFVAINSHVIRPIARECAELGGDLWVVYMGNNEVIGPFGAHGVFGGKTPPQALIRANLAVKQTCLGQFFDTAVQRLRRGSTALDHWHGMEMWNEPIGRKDPRIDRVLGYFNANLEDILSYAHHARVPTILSTVGCNLKDCSPLGSVHRSDLSQAQRQDWERAYQAGVKCQSEGKPAEARVDYEAAARLDEGFADLQFRWGRCCLELGQTNEARAHLERAKDEDALQFRPDTRLNEMVRQAAMAHGGRQVRLLDAAELFRTHSPGGLPGEELFYEHVHLTPTGNYLLARAAAELAARVLPLGRGAVAATNAPGWLGEEECAQRLGLTDWGRYRTWQRVEEHLSSGPFTRQLIHSNQMEKVRAELQRLRPAQRPAGVRAALRQVQQARQSRPADPYLLEIEARLLEDAPDSRAAEGSWRELIRQRPWSAQPYLDLGNLLGGQGRDPEAAAAYQDCLARHADLTEAHGELGLILLRLGRPFEAVGHFQEVARRHPGSAAAAWNLGQALLQSGRSAQAALQFRQVLRLDPKHEAAQRALAELPGREGR